MPASWIGAMALVIAATCLAASPSPAQDRPARIIALSLVDGRVSGPDLSAGPGAPVLRAQQGERLDLHWTSDRAVVLHLHGYDREAAATPGTVAVMPVEARATGRFPVETHGDRHATVLYLEVHPGR